MRFKNIILQLQNFYILSARASLGVLRRPYYGRDIIEQMDYAGVGSFLIVLLVSVFIGMALFLQISAELSTMGLQMYTGKIVGISILREIGPVAVALSFAGRVGSGMASEIGSMVLGHQIDVLRVFGADPVKKLVTPRLVSSILMLPVLTVLGDAIALAGGYLTAVFITHQSGSFYLTQIKDILIFQNVFSGIVKPFIFGYLIGCISCYMGLSTRGGSRGLRQATTASVVASTIMIIITDFVVTKLLLITLGVRYD